MNKNFTLIAAMLICIGVILGAIGSHVIKGQVSPEMLDVFEKSVRYQFYAAFGMLILALNADRFKFPIKAFFWTSMMGILIFCGGLYLYTFHEGVPGLKFFARIVPIGGFCMIGAWIIFMVQLIRSK